MSQQSHKKKLINVDIHWDFARSIHVEASNEEDAKEIVEKMMRNRAIPQDSFEPMEYWELDTTYQPEKI